MIFNDHDLDRCQQEVQKAFDQNNKKVHIVPTIYGLVIKKQLKTYLYKDRHGELQLFNENYLASYQSRLLSCIKFSKKLGLNIYLTPHIDDKDQNGTLRYYIKYSPTQKYSGYSFANIMFYYLNKLPSEIQKHVYLSLIGETDRSLYKYPDDYKKVLTHLSDELKVGLSFSLLQSQVIFTHFRKVPFLDELDFLGVSAYNAIKSRCTPNSFEKIAQKFWRNMRKMGMTKKLHLIFTEIGLGGNSTGSLITSLTPISGRSGKYERSKDPWQIKSNSEYRKRYYSCLLGFLRTTPTIQAAFLWNSDSWDVQGFYHYSANYRDEEISSWIVDHNFLIED